MLFGLARRVLGVRLSRYALGSALAFAISELTLIFFFGTGLVGPAIASVIAFVAGAVPNYLLNRSWVWDRRGRIDVAHELAPYILVSVVTLGVAAAATSTAAAVAPAGRHAQTAFVSAAYLAAYVALFFAKYSVFHRFIFSSDDARETSR